MKTVLNKWFKRNFSDPEAVFLTVILTGFFIVFMTMGDVLFPIVASLIIAYLLNGFVTRLEKWKVSHLSAVIIVFCLFIGFVTFILIWLLPLVFQQLSNLFAETPNMLMRGQQFLSKLQTMYPDFFSPQRVNNILNELGKYVSTFGQVLLAASLSSIGNIITIAVYLVLAPFLIFFFLKDKKQIKSWTHNFLPEKHDVVSKILQDIDSKIANYISGRLIEVVIVTVICLVFFLLMGLNFAVLLSVCVGISVIIPYVGAVLVTIPIIIIAFFQWGFAPHFAYLLIIYAIIITIDANVLVPLLFSGRMKLHPVGIIIALLFFGYLWGFWGIFFAIPLATLVDSLITNWPQAVD
jgi:putative permease